MAGGPVLNIGVSADLLAKLGRVGDVARAADKEIKTLERDAAKAEKAGQQLDDKSKARLKQLDEVSRKAHATIDENERANKAAATAMKDAKSERKLIHSAEKLFNNGTIRALISGGEVDPIALVSTAVSSEKFAAKLAKFLGKDVSFADEITKSAPYIMFAVSSVKEAVKVYEEEKKLMKDIANARINGGLTYQEQKLLEQSYLRLNDKPLEELKKGQEAATALTGVKLRGIEIESINEFRRAKGQRAMSEREIENRTRERQHQIFNQAVNEAAKEIKPAYAPPVSDTDKMQRVMALTPGFGGYTPYQQQLIKDIEEKRTEDFSAGNKKEMAGVWRTIQGRINIEEKRTEDFSAGNKKEMAGVWRTIQGRINIEESKAKQQLGETDLEPDHKKEIEDTVIKDVLAGMSNRKLADKLAEEIKRLADKEKDNKAPRKTHEQKEKEASEKRGSEYMERTARKVDYERWHQFRVPSHFSD